MPKRSGNSDCVTAGHKRMKKDIHGSESLGSSYTTLTTAELWEKLGFYVQREVFSYMDIRISDRCCRYVHLSCLLLLGTSAVFFNVDYYRVSNSWKSQLADTKASSKGIAFLDWRVEEVAEVLKNNKLMRVSLLPLYLYFQRDYSKFAHLIFIGSRISTTTIMNYIIEEVFAGKKPLDKITFWGGRFTDMDIIRTAAPLQDKCTVLQFMQCDVRWDREYLFHSDIFRLRHPFTDWQRFSWAMPLSVQDLVLDGAFKQAGGFEEQRLWLLKEYDRLNLI